LVLLGIDDHIPENRASKACTGGKRTARRRGSQLGPGEEMSIDKLVGANRVDGKTQISVIRPRSHHRL
jgi:hypothetical protein